MLILRNRESGWPDVGERDRAFAVEYITNGYKHGDAAEAVGLVRSSGTRKLREPLVSAFIRFMQETRQNSKLITQHFVEQKYLEVLPKLMGEEEVDVYDAKEGVSVRVKKFHSAETVSVLRDLGKAAGYIADDGPRGAAVNVQINMGGFTGEEPTIVIEHEDEQ